jgi:2-(3-amino-3-carboxypropyl)histidine synthase
VIISDVVYGACCVDDLSARKLGVELLVHYGHSCLVPITETVVNVLYIFVNIKLDAKPLIETILLNFPDKSQPIAIMGTIQFINMLHASM